jgi:hypothetical protein
MIQRYVHEPPLFHRSGQNDLHVHAFPHQEYLRLTDCVLKTIECSRDPALGKSQAIIRRLRKRQLYKLVDTILLPKAIDAKVRKVTNPIALHCVYPHVS